MKRSPWELGLVSQPWEQLTLPARDLDGREEKLRP